MCERDRVCFCVCVFETVCVTVSVCACACARGSTAHSAHAFPERALSSRIPAVAPPPSAPVATPRPPLTPPLTCRGPGQSERSSASAELGGGVPQISLRSVRLGDDGDWGVVLIEPHGLSFFLFSFSSFLPPLTFFLFNSRSPRTSAVASRPDLGSFFGSEAEE